MSWVCLLLCSSLLAAPALAGRPPNIVLILGDDYGWPYSGFMGDPVAITPSLDTLAAEGTVFTNTHVSASICMPSQETLLAGIHPTTWARTRAAVVSALGPIPFREEVVHYRTLPRELQRVGYLSWEGGKMWASSFSDAGFTHGLATRVPPDCPFFCVEGDDFGRTGIEPFRAFLDQVGHTPFFAWVAPALPHGPLNAPQEYRTPYEQMGRPVNEVDYYANVTWLDVVVGEVLAELDRRGLRDDTLVVYLADNGVGLGQVASGRITPRIGRGKDTLYELGFRTPLILRWPGEIPSGVVREDLVASQDVFATLLDYAGAPPIPDREGRSLKPSIESGAPFGRERVVTFYDASETLQINTGHVVRTPSWRYIAFEDSSGGVLREELYEIALDPFEEHDVAALHPELLAGFRADVAGWETQLGTAPDTLEVAGRLQTLDGDPIAAARLELAGGPSPLWAETDARGYFVFEDVARGAYQLSGPGVSEDLDWESIGPRVPVGVPLATLGPYLPLTARVRFTDHLLAGGSLNLRSGRAGSRLGLRASREPVSLGAGEGSVDDPRLSGATLRLVSRNGGFDLTYVLPAEGWERLGPKAGSGYRYRDRRAALGPITRAVVRAGRLIHVYSESESLGLGLRVDPAAVDAMLTIGTQRHCLRFGGETALRRGRFRARSSEPPASCP